MLALTRTITALKFTIVIALHLAPCPANAEEPSTRELNLLGWQEFAEIMQAGEIETVLLPTGTLEPHGVLPNGSDNIAPQAMAASLAPRLNALIAPTLNYGFTGSFAAFPGSLSISEQSYEVFIEDILSGLANAGFLNIVIVNGHGGGQTAVLSRVAERVSQKHRVRTLVSNWWTATSDITLEVFGEDGGHAGNNESAYIQAIVPEHVHADRYRSEMAAAREPGIKAFPFPSSIVLYKEGQGYPDFNASKAQDYYQKVNQRMGDLIEDHIRRWDLAGIYR